MSPENLAKFGYLVTLFSQDDAIGCGHRSFQKYCAEFQKQLYGVKVSIPILLVRYRGKED
jgi:hypothetical protein